MRRFKFVLVPLVVGLLVAFAAGCGNVMKNTSGSPVYSEEVQSVIQQYSCIGVEHNKLLSDFYFDNESLRSVTAPSSIHYKSLSVEEYS